MKKKSVRKVTSAKKVISKSPLKKKKSFSLKSWLLGGLVILVASAYGLYQYNLQPQGIKVLQIPGTVLDYLEPEAVSINAVKNCGQDPECADLVDAARRAGATTSLQQQSQTSIRVAREIEQSLESKPIKESKNEEVIEAREEAVKTAESIVTKVETQINTHLNAAKIANQPVVGSGAGCQTQHFTVAEGETMVGLVANSQTDPNAGENTGSNMIVKCSGGSWVPTGCYEKNGVVSGPSTCRLSVKPIYAGGKNCYNNGGSSVLGDGSISEKGDGTASRCDGGKMTEGLTKVDGLWMTASEKTKYDFDRDVKKKADQAAANKAREWECVNAGDDGKVGKWNGNGCVVDSRADNCTAKGSGYEWNSSSETCVDKNTKTPYSMQGCEHAIVDKNKEECKRSTDNPNLWLIVPKGGAVGKSGIPAKTSSEINVGNTNYNGSIECANALKLKGAGYTCEPIAGGNYYKLTPVSQLPAPQREFVNAPGSFGSGDTTVSQSGRKVEKATECDSTTEKPQVRRGTPEAGGGIYCVPLQIVAETKEDQYGRKVEKATECDASIEKPQVRRGTPEAGGGIYCVPKDIEKGSLIAGDSCDGKNDLCSSNDCRNIENQDGERGWYCMSEQSHVDRTIWDNPWIKYNGITTLPAYGIQSVRGLLWVKNNSLPNGAFCFGQANACISGYCANNRTFDTCETDPFSSAANNNKRCAPGEIDSSIEVINNGKWEYSGITCPFGCENGECKDSE